ncbi:MAG TPA: serine protease [Candidatus Bathyarchaeia archaeon]|nr:serine protease [Candidatus Bathyarchaeia archaeon]
MPPWGTILKELNALKQQKGPIAFDEIRRKYLVALQQHTGRSTVLYAARWTHPLPLPVPVSPEQVMITEEDMEGFMEAFTGLSPDTGLDIILHSPGGSAEATEALVTYIRSEFSDVRVIIPHAAMSAATMLACSANKIVMGAQSSIGPIDPQFTVIGEGGVRGSSPAQAILDQFALAKKECRDRNNLGAWVPMLTQYGPALLVQCEEALKLSRELVRSWLARFMFHGQKNGRWKAGMVAERLAKHATFKTHARHIGRDQARSYGLVVDDLEKDPVLEDLVLSVFHATSLTFNGTPTMKLIENHLGNAWVRQLALTISQQPTALSPATPSPPLPPGPSQN